jgi:hypothetical protein
VRKTIEEGDDNGAMMNTRRAVISFGGRRRFHGEEPDERYRPGVWLVLSSYFVHHNENDIRKETLSGWSAEQWWS